MNEDAVCILIRRAENDFKTAKDELSTPEPATDAVCFHAQQCCEKYFKAYLAFHGKEIPRTHDLAFLINHCSKIDSDFQKMWEWNVDTLTHYAVETRYDEPLFPTQKKPPKP